MRALIVATHNAHKTAEIAAILGSQFAVSDLRALPDIAAPEETGSSFAENARLKAIAASRRLSGIILADDSGLEVDALGGRPGIFSARYAGIDANDETNRARLLSELNAAGAKEHRRTARFRCAMVIAEAGAVLCTCEAAVEGTICEAERGRGGFGYDPLFVPAGYQQTFAELPVEVKNRLSHRARALVQVRDYLAVNDGP